MAEAYIIDAVRTPVRKLGGGLSGVHPADLGAFPIRQLMDRTGVDPAAVDDVIFGCLDMIGPQAGDVARTCWLAAGMPEEKMPTVKLLEEEFTPATYNDPALIQRWVKVLEGWLGNDDLVREQPQMGGERQILRERQ